MNNSNFNKFIYIIILLFISLTFSKISAQTVYCFNDDDKLEKMKYQVASNFLLDVGGKYWIMDSMGKIQPDCSLNIACNAKIYIKSRAAINPDEWWCKPMERYANLQKIMAINGWSKIYDLYKKSSLSDKNKQKWEEYLASKKFIKYGMPAKITKIEENLYCVEFPEEVQRMGIDKKCVLAKLSIDKGNKVESELNCYFFTMREENNITNYTGKQILAAIESGENSNRTGGNLSVGDVVKIAQEVALASSSSNTTGIPEKSDEPEIISDVDVNIPISNIKRENTFALIIANEKYNKVAAVPFSHRDGLKVQEYFNKTLGIPESNISYVKDATLNDLRYELNRLKSINDAYKGDAKFVVYYSGHGIPSEDKREGYILPVDGYGNDVSSAFAVSELYDIIGNLGTQRNMIFMDACFSGANKDGSMLVSTRGVSLKVRTAKPVGNLIVVSACQGDETASAYEEKGHGLFTYYFLKKLQESNGTVTIGDLENYITDNVCKTSIVANGKSQTPCVSVSAKIEEGWRETSVIAEQ